MSLLKQVIPTVPDFSKPVFKLFPSAADDIKAGNCPFCQKPIGSFKDALSEREFSISGLCQDCQDSIFCEPIEPGDEGTDFDCAPTEELIIPCDDCSDRDLTIYCHACKDFDHYNKEQ